MLTNSQMLLFVLVAAAAIQLTRMLPFLLFPSGKETPAFVVYLGKVLPYANIALLVVYCLQNTKVLAYSYGIPELIAVAAVVSVHLLKRNNLLSIAGGTVLYMILVQFVF